MNGVMYIHYDIQRLFPQFLDVRVIIYPNSLKQKHSYFVMNEVEEVTG